MHSWNHLQLLSCCVYSLSAAVGGSCVAVWATTLYTRICGERFKKLTKGTADQYIRSPRGN